MLHRVVVHMRRNDELQNRQPCGALGSATSNMLTCAGAQLRCASGYIIYKQGCRVKGVVRASRAELYEFAIESSDKMASIHSGSRDRSTLQIAIA